MGDARKLQSILQTLADANRLRIIKFIGKDERSVSEIVNETKLSQPLVSHHLKTLRNRQILETKRQGPFIYYKLKDSKLLDAFLKNSINNFKFSFSFLPKNFAINRETNINNIISITILSILLFIFSCNKISLS